MKKHFVVYIFVLFGSILVSCAPDGYLDIEKSNLGWQTIEIPPFYGYICGFEHTETFIQLPVFFNYLGKTYEYSLTASDIASVTLAGDGIELICRSFDLHGHIRNEKYNYTLATFSFLTQLPEAGEYLVNQLIVELYDGTVITNALGEILFIVKPELNVSSLRMRSFMINQSDPFNLRISFANTSEYYDITILTLSYPKTKYAGVSVKMFAEFHSQFPESGLTIPPTEERTFHFTFQPNNDFFSLDQDKFLLLRPFVHYYQNGFVGIIPAQTQATVVQPPFTIEFILSLFNG